MSSTKKLWTLLGVLLAVSFGVLLWSGYRIHQAAPPMPERVVPSDGSVIYTRAEIERDRQVWQSMGGMQLGSIWGHGGYVAPRGMKPELAWHEGILKTSFWCLNIGLALMALLTLLPLGTLQLFASLEHGYWYARSAEFMQQPLVDLLVWLRVPGDTIFAIGALALALFVVGLWIFPRREDERIDYVPERCAGAHAALPGRDH